MNFQNTELSTVIPTKIIDSICMNYNGKYEVISVPLATFETPLFNSTKRGALISKQVEGINVCVISDVMTRSIILETLDLNEVFKCKTWIEKHFDEIADVIKKSSRFVCLKNMHMENVGCMLYVRFGMSTGNASGHNITTKAADEAIEFIINKYQKVKYVSISGNYCVDKKVSAINGVLGRGKRVCADVIISKNICESILKTSPEKIVELNIKKNLIGSIIAGSVRSGNAHYANILAAVFLATGQDVANIVEASQGITFAEVRNDSLYFSINMPNIIVGTVGNGKKLDFAVQNLELMGCKSSDETSAARLAAIIGATTLCAELSLLAAQTNIGELMASHIKLERNFI